MNISVIIPALDEAGNIGAAITSARRCTDAEVVVVDGGSRDGTADVAAGLGAVVTHSPRGRAVQMNRGAVLATGDVLLFLHADTTLPEGYEVHIRRILEKQGVVAGAFMLGLDAPGATFRVIERLANFRSRAFGLPYGDQAIFITASAFRAVGGYIETPIMEDYDLMRRVGRLGKVELAPARVTTSARRWLRLGVIKTTLINQANIVAWHAGVSPERIKKWAGASRRL